MPTQTFTTPGNGTWTVPAGCNVVNLRIWSAGNAGGNDSGGNGGGGGAGGGYVEGTVYVTPGAVINYRVGAGGQYGVTPAYRWNVSPAGARDGQGDITAFGGAPVTSGAGAPYWLGGAFAEPGGTNYAQGADYNEYGGSTCDGFHSGVPNFNFGGFGSYLHFYAPGRGSCGSGATGGGGGSSAGTGSAGNDGNSSGVGGAAPTGGASGGDHGANGASPGGGGGGASNTETPGNGGDGQIEITYTLNFTVDQLSEAAVFNDVSFHYYNLTVAQLGVAAVLNSVGLAYNRKLPVDQMLGGYVFNSISNAVPQLGVAAVFNSVTFRRTYALGNWSPGFPLPPMPGPRDGGKL